MSNDKTSCIQNGRISLMPIKYCSRDKIASEGNRFIFLQSYYKKVKCGKI